MASRNSSYTARRGVAHACDTRPRPAAPALGRSPRRCSGVEPRAAPLLQPRTSGPSALPAGAPLLLPASLLHPHALPGSPRRGRLQHPALLLFSCLHVELTEPSLGVQLAWLRCHFAAPALSNICFFPSSGPSLLSQIVFHPYFLFYLFPSLHFPYSA